MKYTVKEVLQYVEENDVKFVKLTFCDLFGRQKNVSIVSQQLPSIFENGYLFNSSAVRGFASCADDLILFPDPKTLTTLPWRPQVGGAVSMLSNVKCSDGSFYASDALHMLDLANVKLSKKGLQCEIGTECEFYVFKLDEEEKPTSTPIDNGTYFDSSPDDAGENIRRDIILSLEDMGIVPTASHHETGPGQNEIDFLPTEPYVAARNLLYFKSAVRNVCRLSGMHASFDPKPIRDKAGSGLRIQLTVEGLGGAAPKDALDSFAAGIMNRAGELIAFSNSTSESYKLLDERRNPAFGENHERGAYLNAFPLPGGKCRIVLNSADCLSNPFLMFTLLLEAGLNGMENKEKAKKIALPISLGRALDAAENSAWLRNLLGDGVLGEYVSAKREIAE